MIIEELSAGDKAGCRGVAQIEAAALVQRLGDDDLAPDPDQVAARMVSTSHSGRTQLVARATTDGPVLGAALIRLALVV